MGVGHGVGYAVLGGEPPPGGHVLDENTVALWRFDETESVMDDGHAYSTAAALNGDYTLTAYSAAQRPYIVGGPKNDGEQLARFFTFNSGGGYGGMQKTSVDDTFKDVLRDSYTIECFINLVATPSSTATLFFCGAAGSAESGNYLFWCHLNTSRQITIVWEHGSGTSATFSSTVVVPLNTWTHLAFVVTKTGASAVVQIYMDGALEETSGSMTAATGGTDSAVRWDVGTTTGQSPQAMIADIRISSVARTLEEVAASSTAKIHENDEDTFEIWRFSELPECFDIGPYGFHLGPYTLGSVVASAGIADPLFEGSVHSREFGEPSTDWLTIPWHPKLLEVLQEDELTVEFWIQHRDTAVSSSEYLFTFFGHVSNELEATNRQLWVWLSTSPAGGLTVLWESGGGTNMSVTTTATVVGTGTEHSRHHIAIVRYSDGGGAFDLDLYVDGVFVEQIGSSVPKPTGGTDTSLNTWPRFAVAYLGNSFFGRLDDMRVSNVARSAGEIAASAARG